MGYLAPGYRDLCYADDIPEPAFDGKTFDVKLYVKTLLRYILGCTRRSFIHT